MRLNSIREKEREKNKKPPEPFANSEQSKRKNNNINKKNPEALTTSGFSNLAEQEGFEPSVPFWGTHDFQSCPL